MPCARLCGDAIGPPGAASMHGGPSMQGCCAEPVPLPRRIRRPAVDGKSWLESGRINKGGNIHQVEWGGAF